MPSFNRRKFIASVACATGVACFESPAEALSVAQRIILFEHHKQGLPSGALGLWDFAKAVTSPRRAVPNEASSAPISANLITAPRRLFGNTAFYSPTSATVTDNVAAGPDGQSYACSVNGTGNWSLLPASPIVFPTGTYTFALDYKSNTGVSQSFRHGISGTLVTETATTSWQTYTQTLSLNGSANFFLCLSPDGVTAGNILIDNFRIYAGSTDLGAQPLDTHLYLGISNYDTLPVISSAGVDFSAPGALFLGQFASGQALSAFTVLSVTKKTTDTGATNYQPILSEVSSDNALAAFHDGYTNGINEAFGGSYLIDHSAAAWGGSGQVVFPPDTLFNPLDTNYQVRAFRYDGATASIWLNGIKYLSTAVSGKTGTIQDLWNLYASTNFYSKAIYNLLALYPSALSDVQMAQATSYLRQRCVSESLQVGIKRFICFEGDSISDGGSGPSITTPFCQLYQPNSSPLCYGIKYAVGGSTLAGAAPSLANRQAIVNAMIPANKNGCEFVYFFMIGHNDFAAYSSNASGYAAAVGAFAQQQKNAGWDKVVLGTITPSTVAGFNTWQAAVNAIFTGTGWAASFGIDAIADVNVDPLLTNAADTTYYGDGTHFTQAGHTEYESGVLRSVLNGLA